MSFNTLPQFIHGVRKTQWLKTSLLCWPPESPYQFNRAAARTDKALWGYVWLITMSSVFVDGPDLSLKSSWPPWRWQVYGWSFMCLKHGQSCSMNSRFIGKTRTQTWSLTTEQIGLAVTLDCIRNSSGSILGRIISCPDILVVFLSLFGRNPGQYVQINRYSFFPNSYPLTTRSHFSTSSEAIDL